LAIVPEAEKHKGTLKAVTIQRNERLNVYVIYRVYLKWLDKLQERFRRTKTRKQVHMNTCPLTLRF
jgi:hypothetical protein